MLLAPSASLGQIFSVFGCLDGAPCDTTNISMPGTPNVIHVTNLDIGQDFSLSGELTYFPATSPGGGISSNLSSALGGVRFTNGSITYSATPGIGPGPITTGFDLLFFEPSSAPTPGNSYTTAAAYSGSIMATTAPGARSFGIRTIPNGGLGSFVVGPSSGAAGFTSIAASASVRMLYTLPSSGTENVSVVAGLTAYPGDVFTFPASIEVGIFLVPEPTSLVLAGLCLMSACCIRRRRALPYRC